MPSEDPRRFHPISIVWNETRLIGQIHLGSKFWGAVEWSEKRQQWCVEDAAGQCLKHVASIHGTATSKAAAVRLAKEMIRDGRMPTPSEAYQSRARADDERRRLEREKRAQQPSVQRRRAEARERHDEWSRASTARWEAERREDEAQPLYEMLHQIFDFADPDLWRSNSFATMRPRLIIHVEAVVADLESDQAYERSRQGRRRDKRALAEIDARIAKAREILDLLHGRPAPAKTVADGGDPAAGTEGREP